MTETVKGKQGDKGLRVKGDRVTSENGDSVDEHSVRTDTTFPVLLQRFVWTVSFPTVTSSTRRSAYERMYLNQYFSFFIRGRERKGRRLNGRGSRNRSLIRMSRYPGPVRKDYKSPSSFKDLIPVFGTFLLSS